ncbi:unnamed protein product [Pieris macdunnoughi]|uniref:Kelch-like protein diablo n=1 Tax=Pieris macdunnoughi TaxID=345717 RepID=A0A821TAY4_9NEOP|nr:unnamed protein product [Pieris macdunnoughi]
MEIGDEYRNGDGRSGASGASRSDDSADEEESALEAELSLEEPDAAARTLHALNALRKARQHYDVTLLARGVELPAHRALLAALSPAMLASLPAAATATPLRLDVDPDALHALLDYAYTGRLRVKDATAARRLYRAAALLRVESARAHLADRLLRRITPQDCLTLRSLPDLAPPHRRQLDAYVAQHFDEVWGSSALAALPLVRLELLRETSADSCGERAATLASAALAWLRASPSEPAELAARSHLLYVDAGGALQDCGDLPAARGDAPDLEEYKRERASGTARHRGRRRVAWRGVSASDTPRGGRLAAPAVDDDSADLPTEEGPTRARMSVGRCAVGAAELGGRLVVCGGYDSARVLRSAEAYDPEADVWAPLPDMRRARARFPAARLGARLYVLGGSDGYSELDSVDVLSDGAWVGVAALPVARQYAAAAAHEARGELYVVGGSAGGRSLRAVHRYDAAADAWSDAPPLATGRSQCAAAVWAGALWALGGCDEWRCLASTETLALDGAEAGAWSAGPALPSARRSVGACVWRGALWAAGGSAGAASLRCTVLLAARGATWRPGPSLRRPRAAPALVPVGASLFAAGGYSGKRFLSCVECLHEPDGVWTTLLESVEVTPDATRLSLTPSGRETEEAV